MLIGFIFLFTLTSLYPYRILYTEQFYKLYHLHFYQYPDDCMENIYYLEQALKAEFCNPLYALAKIENKHQWERYKQLFTMHIYLRLIQLYLTLGNGYDKKIAYFYNEPWKRQNLESLKIAEQTFKVALLYWDEAKKWSRKIKPSFIHLDKVENWEDEHYRIQTGELDYGDIIQSHLQRLQRVRRDFENMDETTY
ncbi:MAG: hypothetical protein JXJ04_12920 [Spirochaetales bacterium]|nr:hypothetical protein [Spirochaetales bacterium]